MDTQLYMDPHQIQHLTEPKNTKKSAIMYLGHNFCIL
jgi:hypothetical protein